MKIKERIARWLYPEIWKIESRYHWIMSDISESRAWLSEFPEILDTTTRLLEKHTYQFSETECPMPELPTGIWEFREYLRRNYPCKQPKA